MSEADVAKRPARKLRAKPAEKRWCLFDTETTGLIKNGLVPLDRQPQVIEFYGMHINEKGEVLKELELLVDPGKPLEPIITKITALRDADLRGKPSFRAVADQIAAFIEEAQSVVAHNLSYDLGVLNFEYQRLKRTLAWPMSRICTVEQTEHLKGFRLSLSKLHIELFGEDFPQAHRARNDVAALQRCFVELKKRDLV